MATLYVRDIPDNLYSQVQKIAVTQGRSLSAYVQAVLQEAVDEEKLRQASSKALANIKRRRRALPPEIPDSVTMLRHIRGEDE